MQVGFISISGVLWLVSTSLSGFIHFTCNFQPSGGACHRAQVCGWKGAGGGLSQQPRATQTPPNSTTCTSVQDAHHVPVRSMSPGPPRPIHPSTSPFSPLLPTCPSFSPIASPVFIYQPPWVPMYQALGQALWAAQ